MTYTFDIFDTLITRKTASPYGIFLAMQEFLIKNNTLIDNYVKQNFAEIRLECEKECRILLKKNEITLFDIYKYIDLKHYIGETVLTELCSIECQIEYELSLPIQKNIDLLKTLCKTNPVYLISDMYLPLEHIRKMLLKHDAIFANIPIFLSSELNKTKSAGELYEYFLTSTNTDKTQWIHYGDNVVSDKKATSYGAVFKLVENFYTAAFETYKKNTFKNDLAQELSLAVTKNLKLSKYKDFDNDCFLVGKEIASPILSAYINWVLCDAINNNIEILYFITRDGVILKSIADTIIKERKLPIKTKLIYGSRQSFRFPILLSSKQQIANLLRSFHYKNIEQLYAVLEIDKNDLFLDKYFFTIDELDSYDCNYINNKILSNEKLLNKIVDCAEEKKKLAKNYLLQEINITENFAFVELQGTGKTQQCIYNLLHNELNKEIFNYYYSLYSIDNTENPLCRFKMFAPTNIKTSVIELLCRAPYGQVVAYNYEEGMYKPKFERCVKDSFPESAFLAYKEGITEYIVEAEKRNIYNYTDFRNYSLKLCQNILNCQNEIMRNFISKIPFCNSFNDVKKEKYAPLLDESFIKECYKTKYKDEYKKLYKGFIFNYSLQNSSKKIQDDFLKFLEYNETLPQKQCSRPYIKGNIIIYGAGKKGKQLYKELKNNSFAKIVLWCDKKFMEMNECEQKISAPNLIYSTDFDYLFIAVANPNVYEQIRSFLIEKGIDTNKII